MSMNISTFGITFMGATLGSNPTTFTNVLKSKGCRFVTRSNGSGGYTETYQGNFWQFTNATIAVCISHNQVESVHVEWESTYRVSQLINDLDLIYGRHTNNDHYEPGLGLVEQQCVWYVSDGYVQLYWSNNLGLIVSYYLGNPKSNLR